MINRAVRIESFVYQPGPDYHKPEIKSTAHTIQRAFRHEPTNLRFYNSPITIEDFF